MRITTAVCFSSALAFAAYAEVYFKEQFLDGGKFHFFDRACHQIHCHVFIEMIVFLENVKIMCL